VGLSGGPPADLVEAIEVGTGARVTAAEACRGGDINRAWKLDLAWPGSSRGSAFLKTRADAPPGEFEREAAGLRWLGEAKGLRVPETLVVVDPPGPGDASRGLALEWVDAGGPFPATAWEEFGRGLAVTHGAGAARPGAPPPGVTDLGIAFGVARMPPVAGAASFAEVYARRVESLAGAALERGAIDADDASVLHRLVGDMEGFAGPEEPVARLHGDLWIGNVMVGPDSRPWLVDPAAHGGHREIDLAMLELCGSPPPAFYRAYDEVSPPSPGRRERVRLWQVQPLLVHAVLFGGGYGQSAVAAARTYVG
jgi:fructosamine-3-kinase